MIDLFCWFVLLMILALMCGVLLVSFFIFKLIVAIFKRVDKNLD